MELWIRSQDRKHLINCEALMLEQVGTGKWGIRAFSKNYDYNICNYKTKERALEVLDEIQELIEPNYIRTFEYEGYEAQPETIVYEMPES